MLLVFFKASLESTFWYSFTAVTVKVGYSVTEIRVRLKVRFKHRFIKVIWG